MIRSTALRSVRSELLKITSLRSTWITLALFGAMSAALSWGIAQSTTSLDDSGKLGFEFISGGIQLYSMFAIVVATMSVTSEYASNTMQTTTLARPTRWHAFAEKLVAVSSFFGVILALLIACLLVVGKAASGADLVWGNGNSAALTSFWLGMILIVVMTVGFGYILRSTAGTIVTMFGVMFLLNLVTMIPSSFFQEILPAYLPANLLATMVTPITLATDFSRGAATGIFALYALIVAAIGCWRYSTSDV